jgi:hypothetical protein
VKTIQKTKRFGCDVSAKLQHNDAKRFCYHAFGMVSWFDGEAA